MCLKEGWRWRWREGEFTGKPKAQQWLGHEFIWVRANHPVMGLPAPIREPLQGDFCCRHTRVKDAQAAMRHFRSAQRAEQSIDRSDGRVLYGLKNPADAFVLSKLRSGVHSVVPLAVLNGKQSRLSGQG